MSKLMKKKGLRTFLVIVVVIADSDGVTKRSSVGPDNDKSDALQIPEKGYAEFTVDVKQAGYYSMCAEYYPTTDEDDRGISIETKVDIKVSTTRAVPFSGADAIAFQRVYTDEKEPTKDNQGNEIRSAQIEDPNRGWMSAYFEDSTGYEVDPYKFYLEEGENKVRLTGVNEKFLIRKLIIGNPEKVPSYEEYAQANNGKTNNAGDYLDKVQGETAIRRSAPSLYATYDRGSSDTEYENRQSGEITTGNTDKQVLNVIGGTQWKVANDWLEWEMEVPEEGDYVIGIKGRQGYNRGYIANRSLYIDGKIPFKEVSQIRFTYNNLWSMTCLQDEKGEAYKFHLTKGKHVIRLKNTLGDLGEYLSQLSDSVFNMNKMYRTILVLTGTEPDAYRDYRIDEVYPEVMEAMEIESKRLYKLVDEVTVKRVERFRWPRRWLPRWKNS